MIEKEKERGITINNGLGVIGHVGIGTQSLNHSIHHTINNKVDVVVVENHIEDDSFELNGVRYTPVKKDKTVSKGMSKLHGIMAMAQAMYMPYMHALDFGSSGYQRKLSKDINIIKEYELIQRKESNLSKWERDMVRYIFERNFNRID